MVVGLIGLRILNCFLDDFRKNVSRRKPTNDQSARFSVLKEFRPGPKSPGRRGDGEHQEQRHPGKERDQ